MQGDEIIARLRARNEIGWTSYSPDSSGAMLIVTLPHAPVEGPIRDQAGSSLTQIKLRLPVITGVETGGLTIQSYSLQASTDQVSWTALCGLATDYTLTYFMHTGLTTGDTWYYRYVVRNAVGWSEPSPVTQTWVGTEPA